jgi:Ser/Thr protein kinase RdoA (MazF antagonist)
VVSPALVRGILAAYGVSVAVPRDLGGSANLNLLTVDGRRRVVVRVYRSHVPAARVEAVQGVRALLAAGGVPVATPVPALTGATYVEVDGHIVEVETFVDSDGRMNTLDRVASALPMLARVHTLLGTTPAPPAIGNPPFANYVDPAEVVEATRAGTDRIRSWGPTPAERDIADTADQLAEAVAAADAPYADLPMQLVHGDFWDDNVLFRHERVVLVADLDFMGTRRRIDDLALTLFFASCLGDGTPALVDAYAAAAVPPLSELEWAALPIALARQPLWSLAVWVAQLDAEDAARRHIDGHLPALQRALSMLDRLARPD